MNVICRECKYFNKKNLCSAVTKGQDGLTAYVNKIYIMIVADTGKCKWFKRKNKVALIIQELKFNFNQLGKKQ